MISSLGSPPWSIRSVTHSCPSKTRVASSGRSLRGAQVLPQPGGQLALGVRREGVRPGRVEDRPRIPELHGQPVRLLRLRRGGLGVGVAPDRRGGAERERLGQAAHRRPRGDALERAQRGVGVARLQLRQRLPCPQLLGLGVAERDRGGGVGLGRPAVAQRVEDLGAQAEPVVMRRRRRSAAGRPARARRRRRRRRPRGGWRPAASRPPRPGRPPFSQWSAISSGAPPAATRRCAASRCSCSRRCAGSASVSAWRTSAWRNR